MTYEQAFSDWSRLWKVAPAHDMTGAYVDSDDLDLLLRSPTKRTAKECLLRQINHWFEGGVDMGDAQSTNAQEVLESHPWLDDIAERHGFGHLVGHYS